MKIPKHSKQNFERDFKISGFHDYPVNPFILKSWFFLLSCSFFLLNFERDFKISGFHDYPVNPIILKSWSFLEPAQAQIVPDATMPVNSVITPSGKTNIIEGGTRAGRNLFHSFQEFSVPTGSEAFFNNTLDIQNIFSRVTGRSISHIDGLIRANGTANLFFLNPNGIIFGPNARLNIGGSFLASTANSIKFADGSFFGSTNPQNTALLTVSVPVGLQMGSNPGNIVVQGSGHNLSIAPETKAIARDNRPVGLQVAPGQTLALLGGNLTLEGGNLTAEGGRIELGSVGGETLVGLTLINPGIPLSYPGTQNFQDISFSKAASVDASGAGGGDVFVAGRQVRLTDGSVILALTEGDKAGGTMSIRASEVVEAIGTTPDSLISSGFSANVQPGAIGNGGNLTIETARLRLTDGAQGTTGTSGFGKSGNLTVKATDTVELLGTSADDKTASGLSAQVHQGATGEGGNLTIETTRLQLTDGAQATASTFGSGKAGNVTVKATDTVELIGTSSNGLAASALGTTVEPDATGDGGNLTIETARLRVLNGGQITVSTSSSGKAGNLTVKATDTVELVGTAAIGFAVSGLFADVQPGGTGDGGNLTIETARMDVADGALVSTGTSSSGNGGNLSIETDRLRVAGGSEIRSDTYGSGKVGNLTVKATDAVELIGTSALGLIPSGLSARVQLGAEGEGGNLTIETDRLQVTDGARISTSTSGSGKAGNLTIKATDRVEVMGTSTDGSFSSSLSAQVNSEATGDGGNLTIETDRLQVTNGGDISTATFGSGKAGNLTIKAGTVELIGRSPNKQVSSGLFVPSNSQATGDGGNLTIEADRLLVADGAQVSAGTFGSGKAGNLTVKATDAVELVGTSIDGEAVSGLFTQVNLEAKGDGGNLTIKTDRLRVANGAQVSASTSGSGNGGNLTIKATGTVEVTGRSANGKTVSGLFAQVSREGTGDGGDLTIEADRLEVADGVQISVGTFGSGKAGNLTVKAGTVELIGRSPDGQFPSGLFAAVGSESKGNGGNLTIETDRLHVVDGATVSVRSFGEGKAGTLKVDADSIRLDNSSGLTADTKAGGGSIELSSQSITLRGGSSITTNATGGESGGNIKMQTGFLQLRNGSRITTNAEGENVIGGNITLNADAIVGLENSDITANSKNSQGGNITINTQGIFGLQTRTREELQRLLNTNDPTLLDPRNLPTSDITATGANSSLSGNLAINTPEVNPSSGLANLPANPVDATTLVASTCRPRGEEQGEFIFTGRGGLPPSPNELIRNEATWMDLREIALSEGRGAEEQRSRGAGENRELTSIVEAQGWMKNSQGQVVLVAQTATATPQNSTFTPQYCHE
ncbi:filamentous hemagglutinin N-terminal domain-containing protein [Aerosakkonemataceae cyanobacterium BLCC-F50]|uniref:Filamentous hemagglutinin N-terminal domain-containing protein n=1 Tax=Floridaenema flaviceps BLCC-F50 TaxID=3153642 RepID=A0ABV4Y5Q3_9CYAN